MKALQLLKSSQICFCLDMTDGFGSLRPGRLRHSLCPRSSRTHKHSRPPLLKKNPLYYYLKLNKRVKWFSTVKLRLHVRVIWGRS